MGEEVVIISPELVAGAGGVADYTLRLVEEWGDRVAPNYISPNEIKNDLRGKILLQYSAYGFDRVGYPRRLLRSLVEWKKATGGLLVIMFHEIWGFWPLLNKNHFVQRQHRIAIGKLIAFADTVFTSTPSQAEHLRELVPQCNLQVLPVGSNIRRSAGGDTEPASGLAVLFGLQLSRIKALRKMRRELTALAEAGILKKIITLGAQNTAAQNSEERSLLTQIRLTSGFDVRGAVAESEISQDLSRADFAISGQDDLSLTKSGTFMAYAAHGLKILSLAADSLGPEPQCWLINPAELLSGISTSELKGRAENLRAWQERTSSWSIIAARVGEALQLEKAVPA